MSAPHIHRKGSIVPASLLVSVAGDTILKIRSEDGLTWADIGDMIGKSEDQVTKYANGLATMDFTTFLRGVQAWGPRFVNPVLGQIDMHIADRSSDGEHDVKAGMIDLMQLVLELQKALADDRIDAREAQQLEPFIDSVQTMLDGLRNQIKEARQKVRAV